MSERVAKAESLIQQVAAPALRELLEQDAAAVTVTRVDVAPDMHNATVWIGLIASDDAQARIWKRVTSLTGAVQTEVAKNLSMKYVPRLHFKLDTGGAYAAEIERILRDIEPS